MINYIVFYILELYIVTYCLFFNLGFIEFVLQTCFTKTLNVRYSFAACSFYHVCILLLDLTVNT